MPDADRIIVAVALGVIGALAIGIKVAEGINSWMRWVDKGEPVVIDTAGNGGVRV